MKTLLFTIEYAPFKGGVANYYKNLVDNWPESKDIFVLNNNDEQLIKKKWPFLKWLPSFKQLWLSVKKFNIDKVIVGHLLPLGTVAYLESFVLGFDYVVFLHGMDLTYACRSWRKKYLAKLILKRASGVIAVNSFVASLAEKEFGLKNIEIVHPGVQKIGSDLSVVKEKIKKEFLLKDKKVILSIGRLVKRKGVDKMIEAFAVLAGEMAELRYFVIGTGPDEQYLRDKVRELPTEIAEKIVFLGEVDEFEKWAWLDFCDIFAMPSRNINGDFEGLGIVYLEACSTSRPVLAGRSGGIGDAVKDGENGFLVDPEDVQDIAGKLKIMLRDDNLRRKMGETGCKMMQENFFWPKKAKSVFEIVSRD